MIKGASYLSASALFLSTAVHALILVLLVASGDNSGCDRAEESSPPPRNATAEGAQSGEKSEGEHNPVPLGNDVQSAVPQGIAATGKNIYAERSPAAPAAYPAEEGGGSAKSIERKPSGGEAADGVDGGVSEKKIETVVYTVRRGDTLTKLAEKCGMSISELAKLNGKSVKRLSNLWVGQKIKIKANADSGR